MRPEAMAPNGPGLGSLAPIPRNIVYCAQKRALLYNRKWVGIQQQGGILACTYTSALGAADMGAWAEVEGLASLHMDKVSEITPKHMSYGAALRTWCRDFLTLLLTALSGQVETAIRE